MRRIACYVLVVVACLLSGCWPFAVPKEVATYTVTFDADGQHYEKTVSYACYFINIPLTSGRGATWRTNKNRTSIRGSLSDGSKYQIVQINHNSCAESPEDKVQSRIYVQRTSSEAPLVDSFDVFRKHSAAHTIIIDRSSLTVKSDGKAPYYWARQKCCAEPSGAPPGMFYHTISAKLTPFHDPVWAKRDFYNTGEDIRLPKSQVTQPVLDFHPMNATISETRTQVDFDGGIWRIASFQSDQAAPWNPDPQVSGDIAFGMSGLGNVPEQSVDLEGTPIRVRVGLERGFYNDRVSGQVAIVFDEIAILNFNERD